MQFCTTKRQQFCKFEEASCRTCSLRSKKFCWEVAKSQLQKLRVFSQSWGPCTPIWHPLILHWHHHIGRSVQIPSHKIITVVVNRWASELSQWLHKRKRKKKVQLGNIPGHTTTFWHNYVSIVSNIIYIYILKKDEKS